MDDWQGVATSGILVVLILREVFGFIRMRNGSAHVTVAEFRAEIDAFKEFHAHEGEASKILADNFIAQTELLRIISTRQLAVLDKWDRESLKTTNAMTELLIRFKAISGDLKEILSELHRR